MLISHVKKEKRSFRSDTGFGIHAYDDTDRATQTQRDGRQVVKSFFARERSGTSVGSRAVRGSLWVMVGYGVTQLFRLASTLVLTRLLVPEHYGIMALVSALLVGLAMFSDLGLSASVVRSRRGDDPVFLATAWSLQILHGLLLWAIACLAAPSIAMVYGEPELGLLLPVTALAALIGGFNSMSLARLKRHLALRKHVLLDVVAQACALGVMIPWALIRPEVWVLVAGALVSAMVKMIGSHFLERQHRDRVGWNREAFRHLFHFGKWIFVSTILTFLADYADRLIFGRLVSLSELGVYNIAAMLAMLPPLLMNRMGSSIVFPVFSRTLDANVEFRSVYQRTRRAVLALGGFPCVMLLASAPFLVESLYDPRYSDAGRFLQILAVATWLSILEVPSRAALLAWGIPRWLAIANTAKFIGVVVLLPLGLQLGGFVGGIVGFVAAEALRYGVNAMSVRRHGGPGIATDVLASVMITVAAVLGMEAALALSAESSSFHRLGVSAATAVALWSVGALALIGSDLRGLVDKVFNRPSTADPSTAR